MRLPFGKKSLLVILPLVAATVYWRVRTGRQVDERWDEEIDAAADEGIAAARTPIEPDPG